MIQRRWAPFCLLAAAMCIARFAEAGVWGAQPVVGVSGDYYSNPGLLTTSNTAESHAALLVDAPTTYNGDAFKFSVLPSFRLSDSQGYSSLDSDYEHLNVSSEFDTARSALILTAGLARDSSLYHDFILDGAVGVRRDTANADLNWDRHLTERLEFTSDINYSRVRYGQSAGIGTLTDYKYTSIAPGLTWDESEQTKITSAASVAQYKSLDGMTESKSANLQLGFSKKLSEIWSLSATAGYSRANNEIGFNEEAVELTPEGFVLVLIPIQLKSNQNGSIFSVNLCRQTERLNFTADASRKLVPSGFAFLSLQQSYGVHVTFAESERWTLGADVHRIEYQNPSQNAVVTADVKVTNVTAFATWQWTEHWTVTMNASRLMERYGPPNTNIASSGVSVEVARHFDWKQFQ